MTTTDRRQRLLNLGLNPDSNSLADSAVPESTPAPTGIQFAPDGVDQHTMPVSDIVFTDAMVDDFPNLTNMKPASDFLFDQYRSKGKDPDRHGFLHRRITEFLGQVRNSRETGGFVREQVKATRKQSKLAQVMAAGGVEAEPLVALVKLAADLKAQGMSLDDVVALITSQEDQA